MGAVLNSQNRALAEYHYWSDRMCSGLLGDNDDGRSRITGAALGLPLGPLSTGLSVTRPVGQLGHASSARTLSKKAKRRAVSVERLRLGYEPTILSGTSRLVLSSLRTAARHDTGAVTLYSDVTTAEGARVAVCLFGSAANVCGFSPEVPEWRKFGWTSSDIRGVTELLMSCAAAESSAQPDRAWWPNGHPAPEVARELCVYAANICEGQGEFFDRGLLPWRRGYTLGHFENGEWLARIYYGAYGHVRTAETLFDAVLVGAAYWVRGPMRSWVAYDKSAVPDLEASRYPSILRPFVRRWNRGQHPRGTRANAIAVSLGMLEPDAAE
jgi:hypothetical protein